MSVKNAILQFIHGFKDSYYGIIKFLKEEKKLSAASKDLINNNSKNFNKNKFLQNYVKLKQRIIQSCILNGLFLLSCILIFNYILMPLLNFIIYQINSNNYYLLIHSYLNKFIYFSFSFIWIMPVFLLSKIFNVLCYQDIADCAYLKRYKRLLNTDSTISYIIADSIFSCILQIIFLIQSSIFIYIPIYFLNVLLFHLHISLLYALYAFEYKWFNMGWKIKERLKYIELKWPYFFGFGLSLSVLTSLFDSYIINATLFAFLFPVLLLSAIEADCNELNVKRNDKQVLTTSATTTAKAITNNFTSLHLFDGSIILTDYIFRFINYLSDKKRASVVQKK
jgi:etoposide-induced 2.4 mRNA